MLEHILEELNRLRTAAIAKRRKAIAQRQSYSEAVYTGEVDGIYDAIRVVEQAHYGTAKKAA